MTEADPVTPVMPAPELDVYVVFAQRTDARVDIDAWSAHAERFFATRLGLAEDMRPPPGSPAPCVARARFVVAPGDGKGDSTGDGPGIRQASARPRDERDLALAERADGAGTGLALRLATILSSVLLGPILDPGRMELFGAKTARGKLERPRPPIA